MHRIENVCSVTVLIVVLLSQIRQTKSNCFRRENDYYSRESSGHSLRVELKPRFWQQFKYSKSP